MTKPTIRALVGATILAATLGSLGSLGAAAPAGAASGTVTMTHKDPAHDEWSVSTPGLSEQADITRVYVGRGPNRVWARFVTRGTPLPKPDLWGADRITYTVTLRSSHHGAYRLRLAARHMKVTLLTPAGRVVCAGRGRSTVDRAKRYVQFGIPKTCFRTGWAADKNIRFATDNGATDRVLMTKRFVPRP